MHYITLPSEWYMHRVCFYIIIRNDICIVLTLTLKSMIYAFVLPFTLQAEDVCIVLLLHCIQNDMCIVLTFVSKLNDLCIVSTCTVQEEWYMHRTSFHIAIDSKVHRVNLCMETKMGGAYYIIIYNWNRRNICIALLFLQWKQYIYT